MNGMVALCHFCEYHGPSVIMCTQTFNSTAPSLMTQREKKTFYGHRRLLRRNNTSTKGTKREETRRGTKSTSVCDSCNANVGSFDGLITNDDQTCTSFVSTSSPLEKELFSSLRHACIRSISCEVCPGREGPIYFSDDLVGSIISCTFVVKDSKARGFQRFFSLLVLSKDREYLLHSWSFLVANLECLIAEIQAKANLVHNKEEKRQILNEKFSPPMSVEVFTRRRGSSKPLRALQDLTLDPNIYILIHQYSVFLLSAGRSLFKEIPIKNYLLKSFEDFHNKSRVKRTSMSDNSVFPKTYFERNTCDKPMPKKKHSTCINLHSFSEEIKQNLDNSSDCESEYLDDVSDSKYVKNTSKVNMSEDEGLALENPNEDDFEESICDNLKHLHVSQFCDNRFGRSSGSEEVSSRGLTENLTVRSMYDALGKSNFQLLVLHLQLGRTVVVEGHEPDVVNFAVDSLAVFLPEGRFFPRHVGQYLDDSALVPPKILGRLIRNSADCKNGNDDTSLRVDVRCGDSHQLLECKMFNVEISLKNLNYLKMPPIVMKICEVVSKDNLSLKLLYMSINNLKANFINSGKVAFYTNINTKVVLKKLGYQDLEIEILCFWMDENV